jgi:hypothetical protein
MNLKEMTKDDILHAIGLETRRTATDYLLPVIGVFSAGLLVGAGLGLLFAPKRGDQLRSDLRGRVGGVANRLRRDQIDGAEARPSS